MKIAKTAALRTLSPMALELADERFVDGVLSVARDIPWDFALRGYFYLGQDLSLLSKTSEDISEIISRRFGEALLPHCYVTFTYLSRFLPSLYIAEHRDQRPIRRLSW